MEYLEFEQWDVAHFVRSQYLTCLVREEPFEIWCDYVERQIHIYHTQTRTFYVVPVRLEEFEWNGVTHSRYRLSHNSIRAVPGLWRRVTRYGLLHGIDTCAKVLLSRFVCAVAKRPIHYAKNMSHRERRVVHHLNGDSTDDRIENLVVLTDFDHNQDPHDNLVRRNMIRANRVTIESWENLEGAKWWYPVDWDYDYLRQEEKEQEKELNRRMLERFPPPTEASLAEQRQMARARLSRKYPAIAAAAGWQC